MRNHRSAASGARKLTVALVMIAFVVLLALGVRVFVAMGITASLGLFVMLGPDQALRDVGTFLWQSTTIYEYIAIPLFIFTGVLVEATGLGTDTLNFCNAFVGRVPNALSVAVVFASALFASICGSSVANAATLSLVAVPLLEKEGYTQSARGSVVAAGGTLGLLIPPSIPLIIYGVLTDTSIGQLFLAGIVPGLVMGAIFTVYLIAVARPRVLRTSAPDVDRKAVTVRALPMLLLPILILSAIFTGYMAPSEVGALAVLYLFVVGFARRRLTFPIVFACARRAVMTSCMLIMLVATGLLFSQFLSLAQIPQEIAGFIAGISPSKFIVMTAMLVAYLIMGTFLESAAMLILSVPILFPIAMAIGFNPVQFGIFAAINQEVAQIHPPLGINLITVSSITKIPLEKLMLGVLPFIGIQLCMIYLVFFFPQLVLWLPTHAMHH
jgi:C4-dicarboxylate transporter DctM subunit